MLSSMRYKEFVWPHNPQSFSVHYERPCAVLWSPVGGWVVQELGSPARVMEGEGVFYGPDAYARFRELEAVFRQGGAGELIHPVWPGASAFFTRLELRQSPMPDYVAYSFAFREDGSAGQGQTAQIGEAEYHQMAEGESFWAAAAALGLDEAALLALNPWLENPNALKAGDRLRVR